MILKQIISILLLFMSYSNNQNNKISVIGFPENAKAGGVIVDEYSRKGYYVEEVHSWPDSVLGRKIRVVGYSKVSKAEKADTTEFGIPKQQVVGIKRTIYKSEWTVWEK